MTLEAYQSESEMKLTVDLMIAMCVIRGHTVEAKELASVKDLGACLLAIQEAEGRKEN